MSAKVLFIVIALILIPMTTAQAQYAYTVTDLGRGYAWGINNSGHVVGASSTSLQGFLYGDGEMTGLGGFDGSGSRAWGISDSGQVVGEAGSQPFLYSDGIMSAPLNGLLGCAYAVNAGQIVGAYVPDGTYHAFLYNSGTITDLGPTGPAVGAKGVNSSGQVVGQNNETQAFLYSNGTMTDLGKLAGWSTSSAYGINDAGQVVGTYNGGHGFLYSGGSITELGTLGGTYSEAYGINNAGQIVGDSDTVPGVTSNHAFIYSSGVMTDLNSLIDPIPGWTLIQATGINDKGQIVGWGYGPLGNTEAFLLDPVPEPATLSLLALGGLGLLRRRKGA